MFVIVKNVGDGTTTNAVMQASTQDRFGDVTARTHSQIPALEPDRFESMELYLEPPTDRALRLEVELGIDGYVHDRTRTEYHEPV